MPRKPRPPEEDPRLVAMADQMLDELTADMDTDQLQAFLVQLAAGEQSLKDIARYKHPPVDIRTFVESPQYLDSAGTLWPKVMDELVQMNSGLFTEVVLTGAIGVAKALDVDTPIPTPYGFKRMGDLKAGDKVYGLDGSPITVTMAHPVRHDRPCFEVEFSDGSVVVADAEHNWFTQTRRERISSKRTGVFKSGVRTTLEIIDSLKDGKHVNHSVPVAGAVTGYAAILPVDPYVLGIWLGDGATNAGRISTADPEILEEIKKHHDVRHVDAYDYQVMELQTGLKELGVFGDKHVPERLQWASYAQRLALLQGLMDSDGTVEGSGTSTFCNTNQHLIDGVRRLACSLGYKATVTEYRATLNGVDKGPAYKVHFTAYASAPCFRLPRKAAKLPTARAQAVRQRSRYIVAVRPVESRPVRCITVDAADSVYLCGHEHIPTHNTTLALYSQVYQLYLMSCLRSPHAEYDLDPASEIVIIFQSINLKTAAGVDYQRFRAMVSKSPYFKKNFPLDPNIESELIFPNRIIVRPVSGGDHAAIGQNVIGGIIDEANFGAVIAKSAKGKGEDGKYDQTVQNYNALSSRRNSRFKQKGALPGLVCIVSSRNYPGQFTDVKEKEAKTNPLIYVYDKRIWEIAKEGRFSGEWFQIFVGDPLNKPRILVEGESIRESEKPLIMDIPVEFREEFERDMLSNIRDIAGVSTYAIHPFMPDPARVRECFGRTLSVLSRPDCDFVETGLELYPKRFLKPSEPRFVHMDLSLTGDCTGMACGYIDSFEWVTRGAGGRELLPKIVFDFVLQVKPPRDGSEIEFENLRKLLYALRNPGSKLPGLNIKWATLDSFQSRDSIQVLRSRGIVAGLQSVDIDPTPYAVFKTAIMDKRIWAPEHAVAVSEIAHLEREPIKGKIDHPPNGSKDCSDAMCGVVYGLTMRRELWAKHGALNAARDVVKEKPKAARRAA